MLPEDSCGNGTEGTPRFRDPCELGGRWSCAQELDRAGSRGERQIARGPDVRPSQGHQKIDVGRPGPHALDRGQIGPDGRVIQPRQGVEIDPFLVNRPRDIEAIGGLLPRDPKGPQMRLAERDESPRCEGNDACFEPPESGGCGRERNLLLEDDVNDRLETRSSRPHGGHAVRRERSRKVRVAGGEVLRGL